MHLIIFAVTVLQLNFYLGDGSNAGQLTYYRNKRQIYYLCGIYPNQYYSSAPCYRTQQTCANGGRILGVGCTRASQCVLYSTGSVTCINGCCCTVPIPIGPPPVPPNLGFGYCYDGQQSSVRCSAPGQCANGQTCMNGLCYACGGIGALSSCNTGGGCSSNLYCTASNYCCECPIGRTIGRCVSGLCPAGYNCLSNGYCCANCPNNATPIGTCRNGQCGNGLICQNGNLCC